MMHSLVIGPHGPSAEIAIGALWDTGFHSIFRVDDAGEALEVFADVHPGLILLLPEVKSGATAAELARISELGDAPVIVSGADVRQSLRCIGPVATASEMSLAA